MAVKKIISLRFLPVIDNTILTHTLYNVKRVVRCLKKSLAAKQWHDDALIRYARWKTVCQRWTTMNTKQTTLKSVPLDRVERVKRLK